MKRNLQAHGLKPLPRGTSGGSEKRKQMSQQQDLQSFLLLFANYSPPPPPPLVPNHPFWLKDVEGSL
ncbi:hypothetical protein CEXT_387291 [Caerostris extrusa]|uniref:Uncharacterized protein n=1 Tax=Caerostris extrusa TaxID=172846 RepID=A0AAV4RB72_CAEEX|nr:hypothetical protein CEXT_387291 [Caerostris extrusa]